MEGSIKAIDASSVHRITSGQVIVDLATAVKELVENSLDAGAKNIDVRFKDYGVTSIEVVDDGSGISPADYANVALKSHTSKLQSYDGIVDVSSFGFRGEALSSLCQLADVAITTRTEEESAATILLFDRQGNVRPKPGKTARTRGTTVCVSNLFVTVPVRRKEFEKNCKKQFGHAQTILQAYGLISTGVRISLSNQQTKKPPQVLFKTDGKNTRDNYAMLFTAKAALTLMDFSLDVSVAAEKRVLRAVGVTELTTDIQVKGLISKPSLGNGRTSGDRQFFYVNGRPFEGKAMSKAFNEIYKTYVPHHFPSVVADFQLPKETYDVNVSPDKRTIYMQSEKSLLESVKAALEALFEPYRSTYSMNASNLTKEGRVQMSDTQNGSSSSIKRSAEASGRPTIASRTSSASSVDDARGRSRTVDSADIDMEDTKEETSSTRHRSPAEKSRAREGSSSEDRPHTVGTGSPGPSVGETNGNTTSKRARPPSPSPEPSTSVNGRTVTVFKAPMQMTLDTAGASWNMQPADMHANNRKRARVEGRSANGASAGAQLPIRQFARPLSPDNGEQEPTEPENKEPLRGDAVDLSNARPEQTLDDAIDTSFEEDEDMQMPSTSKQSRPLFRPTNSPPELVNDSQMEIFDEPVTDTQRLPDRVREGVMRINIVEVRKRLSQGRAMKATPPSPAPATPSKATEELGGAGIEVAEEEAKQTLSRLVSKADFEQMDIVGQFNLAFIIARRRHVADRKGKGRAIPSASHHDDLMIIDQHASDEKYNFERLQQVTKIDSQRLIIPRTLNLPASDELLAIDNEEVLKFNGFEIELDEEAEIGKRIKLVAMPIAKATKKTEFTFEDLDELLFLLREHTGSGMIRPSKTRKLFAMQACRSSVMVGKVLNKPQMTTIVRHMGTMDQPWNCPHGRNTMRWLSGLETRERDSRFSLSASKLKALLGPSDGPAASQD